MALDLPVQRSCRRCGHYDHGDLLAAKTEDIPEAHHLLAFAPAGGLVRCRSVTGSLDNTGLCAPRGW